MNALTQDPFSRFGTSQFHARDGQLHCEEVAVADIVAEFGSPLYVYSRAAMAERYGLIRSAFGESAHISYAVKANSNLSLLKLFHELGAGFDLVSRGELQRLVTAGLPTDGCVFAGVGKEDHELESALDAGIRFFNVESEHELGPLAEAGKGRGRVVPVAVRINPDVDAKVDHEYIATGKKENKFGLDFETAARVVAQIDQSPSLRLVGYHVHLGSQLRSIEPYLEAFDRVAAFMDAKEIHREGLRYYDMGGGYGITYGDGGELFDISALAQAMQPRLAARKLQLVLEPGRFLVADSGVFLTRILGRKVGRAKNFLLVDGAMNDLIRPALYQAQHPVAAVRPAPLGAPQLCYDVVGPVCESGDFLAKGVELPLLERGDLLAVAATGAYGSSMASNYNSRRRPAEVLVSGSKVRLIRRREQWSDLWAQEIDL